jgi:N-acetylglutamate synthase-like GNAT family acetyltransferase
MVNTEFPTVDLALAQQLERAEAMANAASIDSRRALQPDVGAEWIDVAGTYAMFDGPESPLTQTFGLGLFDPFLDREFDHIEQFFRDRGAPTFHEVCSFVAPETLNRLSARGYSPFETSTVLVRPTTSLASESGPITVRPIREDEVALWSRTAAQGWASDAPELGEFLENLGAIMGRARNVTSFFAELDGTPIGTAAMNINNGVALLAGAATIPSARKQGAQRALLQARLAFAAAHGIDRAMVVTAPGSSSQRNAERQGFRPVYTRAKWRSPA